jgi:hypothetical protein
MPDNIQLPLDMAVKACLRDPTFFPQGVKLAFALRHAYPVNSKKFTKVFTTRLKGVDSVLHWSWDASNVKSQILAVYQASEDAYEDQVGHWEDGLADALIWPSDNFHPVMEEGHDQGEVLLVVSQDFGRGKDFGEWDDKCSSGQVIRECLKGRIEPAMLCASFRLLQGLAHLVQRGVQARPQLSLEVWQRQVSGRQLSSLHALASSFPIHGALELRKAVDLKGGRTKGWIRNSERHFWVVAVRLEE